MWRMKAAMKVPKKKEKRELNKRKFAYDIFIEMFLYVNNSYSNGAFSRNAFEESHANTQQNNEPENIANEGCIERMTEERIEQIEPT